MNELSLSEIMTLALQSKVEDIAPDFRRKNNLTDEQVKKIITTINQLLNIPEEKVTIAMFLLFLQGAASANAPMTMAISIGQDKKMEKRNIVDACNLVTGHKYIRRLAETLAQKIGEFAYNNKLDGELAPRINNRLRSEGKESLTDKERAYCSSFSQSIPELSTIVSERLSTLLAEDYLHRFAGKKSGKGPGNQDKKDQGKGKRK